MVQAAIGVNSTESRAEIRARVKGKFFEMMSTMDQHELKIEEEGGNIQVRQTFDDNVNCLLAFG